jgi:anti-sigma regulatory factor (Ser/Thr protein kinase)
MTPTETHFTLRNDLEELGRLAAEIETFGEQHALSPAVQNAVMLALEEIVTNVISYGFDDDAAHEIGVRLAVHDSELTATVDDDGVPYDPLQAAEPDVTASLDERSIGGLGILLVKKMMDTVTYERAGGRNVLRMRKRLPAPV